MRIILIIFPKYFSNLSTGNDTRDQELISRAHSITKNIHELVNRKLEQADRFAQTQEIQRTLISEVSFIYFIIIYINFIHL